MVEVNGVLDACLNSVWQGGLTSLHWVMCARCQHIAPPLLAAVAGHYGGEARQELRAKSHLLVDPTTPPGPVEYLVGQVGATVQFLNRPARHCFLVLGRTHTLDMTPARSGKGEPELIVDRTIASLYISLFGFLASQEGELCTHLVR